MSPDDIVTGRLLDAEIGRSHAQLAGEIETARAELGGKIDVLAQAQHDQIAAQDLASRLASEEHARVQSSVEVIFSKLDTLTDAVGGLRAGQQADNAVRRWRRWAIGIGIAAAGLFLAAAGQLIDAI